MPGEEIATTVSTGTHTLTAVGPNGQEVPGWDRSMEMSVGGSYRLTFSCPDAVRGMKPGKYLNTRHAVVETP